MNTMSNSGARVRPKTKRESSKVMKFLNSKKVVPYIFVTPFILSFLVLTLYPAIQGIIMSFQSVLPGQVEFIGMQNYTRVPNGTFYKALTNTTVYVILTVIILTFIPMLLAVFLNSKVIKLKTLFRASLFVPALTSTIVGGMIFRLMFGEQETAAANQFISFLGFEPVNWRFTAWSGMLLMVLLASWRWIGVNLLYFLAALQNVPEELYEAADIDGASRFQKLWYITLPQLKPIIIFVSTITIINGFRMFEESFVFWEAGSPGNIGLTVVGYIYQQGIQQNDMGFGAAVGVVLMLIIFVVSFIYLIMTGTFKKEGA
ncbi:L-arabinose transport system permease protein AraP [Halobacillus karajensis]|uniref:L-arabinose transport system permease protein AraP n=2 Tax=Halobacillus karajensis TaxID=195088 RepID=A0A024P8N3_9BACI|nr:L-arabinose transport system permease protein AraP [Halobacillus karajensis]CDQ25203.1 L-arabinose transport system permease protein AraP [Halobacillus karajensis]CDQ28436.1 L-arabinose transport system permease protein AraP [Halobacillus karajensis]